MPTCIRAKVLLEKWVALWRALIESMPRLLALQARTS
jgi:hypothetical protein